VSRAITNPPSSEAISRASRVPRRGLPGPGGVPAGARRPAGFTLREGGAACVGGEQPGPARYVGDQVDGDKDESGEERDPVHHEPPAGRPVAGAGGELELAAARLLHRRQGPQAHHERAAEHGQQEERSGDDLAVQQQPLGVRVASPLWLPDLYIPYRGAPPDAVAVLMLMHLAIALVTYNLLVHLAPVGPARRAAQREPARAVRGRRDQAT